jgi:hypothetical protein
MRSSRLAAAALIACTFGSAIALGADNTVRDYTWCLNRLIDLDHLAVLENGQTCKQFSSYDRASKYDEATGKFVDWSANGDSGQYIRTDPATGEGVMAEMEGPGCIWRIWSANPQGRIRFYLDGAEKPQYEFEFAALFSGKVTGFPKPLVWQRRVDLGGENPASNCYVPIPYAKSCKVTADKPVGQYYHIGYTTYPKDWKIETFNLERTPAEEGVLQQVCKALASCGTDPQPAQSALTIDKNTTLVPGQALPIVDLKGPGTVRQFFAKLASDERWARRKVLLQIFFDGEATAAVEAPIGDFFGDAWDEVPYKSLPLGITEDMNYCYWRMPFAKSARFILTNQGRKPAQLKTRIVYQQGEPAPGAARFHAKWRRDERSKDFDYPFLECTGRGRFVGVALFIDNIVGGWWGEGDEKAWVDGEKFPSTFGTGSEDYFGDAWGIRQFANAFHGCPTKGEFSEIRRQTCYRWHIADSIPFDKSFKMSIENYAAIEKHPIPNDYSSVAYWYQIPDGGDFFTATPVQERIPQGPRHTRGIDAETLVPADKLPAGAEIVTDDDLPEQLSFGKGLKIVGKPGTSVPFALPASEDGKFSIETVLAKGVKASDFEIVQNGNAIGDWVRLSKGPNPLEIRLTGKPVEGDRCAVIVDYFVVEPYRNFVRNWYLIGPFDNNSKTGFDQAYPPETEPFKPQQAFPGKKGQISWQKIRAADGMVTSTGNYFKDNEFIVLYAYCEVISPDDRQAVAHAGSDDGIKVWVNGKLVHANNADRALRPDEDRFDVSLKQGRNTVLVKVIQGHSAWGMTFRITDPDDQLKYTLP